MSRSGEGVIAASRLGPSSALTRMTKRLASYAPGHTVAVVTSEVGPAPAWYHQRTGEVVLSLRFLDDVPDWHLTRLIERFDKRINEAAAREIPGADEKLGVVLGVFQHEVAHSKWSRWLYDSHSDVGRLSERSRLVHGVLRTWEEIRIEKRAYDWDANARIGLRYSFGYLLKLLTEDIPTSRSGVASLWALTVGRAAASIVEPDEVEAINDLACTILGDDTVAAMREILDQAVEWDQHDWRDNLGEIVALAEEWIDLLGITEIKLPALIEGEDFDFDFPVDPPEIDTDSDGDEGADHVKGAPAKDSEWNDVTKEDAKRLLDAVKKAADTVGEDAERVVLRLSNPREKAQEVFGGRLHTGGGWHTREPNHEERAGVTRFATALSRISYQAPSVSKVPSAAPPGRIRSRDAVRRSAERAGGRMVTAKPWERKKRRHSQNPPLTVGLMTDTSGSMSWAQEVVASAAYIFANAITRVGGRLAAVTFGDRAEGVIRPGDVPTKVFSRSADGGTEMFDHAIAALDGVLHLTSSRGAKVLVVISDGGLVEAGEKERAAIWLDRCRQAGTAVVWLDGDDTAPHWVPSWVEYVGISEDGVHDAAEAIASAMERAFRSARGVTI